MAQPRPPKKSESLEIRIPFSTKQAFMAHCRAGGRSASEELRSLIDHSLTTAPSPPAGRRLHQLLAGAMIAAAVGAAAAPALARATRITAFESLDADGDGVITRAEFVR